MRDLDGCRILITRPAGRAETLCRRLRELGARATQAPLLQISPLEARSRRLLQRRLQDGADYDHIVFVSVNAVRFGLAPLRESGRLNGAVCHAVGRATAAELRRAGVEAHHPAAGSGAAALAASPALRRIDGQRALIVRGEGGSDALAETLGARGAAVDCRDVYRSAAPPDAGRRLREAVDAGVDIVAISSWAAWRNFEQLLGDDLRRLREVRCCAVGARAAAGARRVFAEVGVVDDATDKNLLAALLEIWRR